MLIEQRALPRDLNKLAKDLASHLYARELWGAVYIVADEPVTFLRLIRKRWLAILRVAQLERSRTLDAQQIRELSRVITHMDSLRFVAQTPFLMPKADVYVVSPSKINELMDGCHTAYITRPISDSHMAMIRGCMLEKGLVVIYELHSP